MHQRAASHKLKYKELKREIQSRIRQAYWAYIASVITPTHNDMPPQKSFWSFVKRNRTDKTQISSLRSHTTGDLITDPIGKANILNGQFRSVFTDETPLTSDHRSPQAYPDIPDALFTSPGVQKMLEGLDPGKASGPDNIPPTVLKQLAPTLGPILTDLFNRSYQTGVVPQDWRDANVAAIFKKGKKTLAANYRPISLTCICCKLFEHVMTRHVMQHAENHNILYGLQHGFRSGLSCETQLVEFVHDLAGNCHRGHQTDVLVMDFSKAFDKVGHDRLLAKLEHYGITGHTQTWIRHFLTGRRQRVVLDGEYSDQVAVTSGVPQGSVLGPCLFLLYINDLAEDLESVVRLFADDTIAYLTIDSQSDVARLQRDLDRLAHWEALWQMEFHPDKCQVLRVSKKHKPTYCGSYTLHGQLLEIVDQAKYLGVTIQGDLRWDTHVTNITKKANSTLAVLKRNVRVPSKCIKAAAYKALVRPHVEYCSTVWDPSTKHLSKKLEMVQRRSARWVCNSYRTGPNSTGPTEMINDLDWPPLQTRRQNARLSLLYKMANDLVHMSSRTLLTPYPYFTKNMPTHAFTPLDLLPSKSYFSNTFFPRTVQEWNKLSQSTATAPSWEAFKASLVAG